MPQHSICLTNDCFMCKFLPTLPQKRCAELNRRDVDEKAEHLRLLSWLTGLITSFTMTSPIEFNVDPHVIAIVCCSTLLFLTDLKYKWSHGLMCLSSFEKQCLLLDCIMTCLMCNFWIGTFAWKIGYVCSSPDWPPTQFALLLWQVLNPSPALPFSELERKPLWDWYTLSSWKKVEFLWTRNGQVCECYAPLFCLLELVDLHVAMGYGSSSCDDCYGLYLLSWDGNGSLHSWQQPQWCACFFWAVF